MKVIKFFYEWLIQNTNQFNNVEFEVIRLKTQQLTLKFKNLPIDLKFDLYAKRNSSDSVNINFYVTFTLSNNLWCWVLNEDYKIKKIDNGLICDFCNDQNRIVYENKKDFIERHVCVDFLNWCNKSIAPANGFAFFEDNKNPMSSWGRFTYDNDLGKSDKHHASTPNC
jgi:hypothetical protein